MDNLWIWLVVGQIPLKSMSSSIGMIRRIEATSGASLTPGWPIFARKTSLRCKLPSDPWPSSSFSSGDKCPRRPGVPGETKLSFRMGSPNQNSTFHGETFGKMIEHGASHWQYWHIVSHIENQAASLSPWSLHKPLPFSTSPLEWQVRAISLL